MAYTADDFRFMEGIDPFYCGCKKHGYYCICDIRYVDDSGKITIVCHRKQCQDCGHIFKNRIGRNCYFSLIGSYANFLPEYFKTPDEYTYDENHQYDKKKKLDFLRRIIILANRQANETGHRYFTREEIESVKIA